MTSEELNDALYDKMDAEMEKYKGWLLTQPAEDILQHTYEYTMKQDILLSMEFHELDYAQAQVLLESPTPLEDVFTYYNDLESVYMNTIWESIQGRADDVLAAQKALPVYNHSGAYAREHGELEAYRASLKANTACRDAIDDAIPRHYDGFSLDPEGAREVISLLSFLSRQRIRQTTAALLMRSLVSCLIRTILSVYHPHPCISRRSSG